MTATRRLPWHLQLTLDIALSPLVYVVLDGRLGLSDGPALWVSAGVGLAWTAVDAVRTRWVNAVTLCVLGGMAIGGILSEVSGDPRFAVAKDSLYTGVFGLVMLASLAARRPLMCRLVQPFATDDNDPAKITEWDASWSSPLFRRSMRTMTVVWGVGLLAEAASRVALVAAVPLGTAATLSPVVSCVVIAALMSWTVVYGRRSGEARHLAEAATPA